MSRPCSVCFHAESATIDELLRGGKTTNVAVATGYGLSVDAVLRHAKNHLAARAPRIVAPAQGSVMEPSAPSAHGDELAELADHLRRRSLAGSDQAAREYRLILGQQAARNATLPQRDLASEPEWIELRGRLLRALEPFPEARRAVADALREGR